MMGGQHTARVNAGQTVLAIEDFRHVLEIGETASRHEGIEEELRTPGVEP